VLTYDLDVFFIPAKEGLDVLAPIYDYAKAQGYESRAEALMIEGFPVQFIPAYNDLVREAVEKAATLKYREAEAKVVKAEYLAAIALQTGRAKDRERVARLLDEAVIDRVVFDGILAAFDLIGRFERFEKQNHEE